MTTAFVLSGGGSLGAVQAGMLQALAARGIKPDLLVGHGALLVERARIATTRWLDTGGPCLPHPERFLSLHRHPPLVHADTCPGENAA